MRLNEDGRWEPVGPILPTPTMLVDESETAPAVLHYLVLPKSLGAQPMDRMIVRETARVLIGTCEEDDRAQQALVEYVERTFDDHHAERVAANEVWLTMGLEPEADPPGR